MVDRDASLDPWDDWKLASRQASDDNMCEVQPWLMRLPFRMQGTVFAAVRGGDLISKPLRVGTIWDDFDECLPQFNQAWEEDLPNAVQCAYSHTDDAPERQLVQWLRWLTLRPADEREVDHPGSYMQTKPPHPCMWKPSMFGAHPMHWYMHLAHAFEVVGFEFPVMIPDELGNEAGFLRREAYWVYRRLVTSLHLVPESRVSFWERMTEDRIAKGQVVS
jgi:hypothetical protein